MTYQRPNLNKIEEKKAEHYHNLVWNVIKYIDLENRPTLQELQNFVNEVEGLDAIIKGRIINKNFSKKNRITRSLIDITKTIY
jgi:hypothetical protein